MDDADRHALLAVLAQALSCFDAQALVYCLMGNHYHFVLHTHQANLLLLMRHLNGVYAQAVNRRYHKVGHLFQGRFKAILVDREAYLLEVVRYVDLKPVRVRLMRDPAAWAWSSYRAHAGQAAEPEWLDTPGLHGFLLGRPARTAADQRRASERYVRLVASAPDASLWDSALRQQIYLGDEDFVKRMQALAEPRNSTDTDIAKVQRQKQVRTLAQWLARGDSREEARYRAHTAGGISMTAMAKELGLSVSRVSRLIARAEGAINQARA